jgi:hypothetical protein
MGVFDVVNFIRAQVVNFWLAPKDTILTDPSGAPREAVLAFKGLGLALAVACLVLSWFAKDDELSKTK